MGLPTKEKIEIYFVLIVYIKVKYKTKIVQRYVKGIRNIVFKKLTLNRNQHNIIFR